jgi:twitching motility protein PilT
MARTTKVQANRAGMLSLVRELVEAEGSDLHLKVPGRPQLRVGDQLVPTYYDALRPEETLGFAQALLELAREEMPLHAVKDAQVAFGVEGLGRFRAQISRQRGSIAIVVHRIETEPPALKAWGNLDELGRAVTAGRGLVLVGGGRRRAGVLAAAVHHYNQHVFGHMVTVESPLEYLHRDERAGITQREVGTDVASVAEGLRAAMRQDPDAVMVTDVGGPEDAEMVLRAAEEGLMVLAGVPTPDADEAVRAFTRRFPPHREEEIAARVGAVLAGVVAVDRDGYAAFARLDDGNRAALRAGVLVSRLAM